MRLSVIVPTLGRDTLAATLESIVPQLAQGDEVIVVADGPQPTAAAIVRTIRSDDVRYFAHGPTHVKGNSQRNAGIAGATGDYLLFMDDDDVYVAGALDMIRDAARAEAGRSFVFRMDNYGTILWRARRLSYGDVGTPMFVAPNVRGAVPSWRDSDYDFACDFVARHGPPVWREEVVAVVRPHLGRHVVSLP
jgi:glycosyltransferase involved in cell wall biosynthesis